MPQIGIFTYQSVFNNRIFSFPTGISDHFWTTIGHLSNGEMKLVFIRVK